MLTNHKPSIGQTGVVLEVGGEDKVALCRFVVFHFNVADEAVSGACKDQRASQKLSSFRLTDAKSYDEEEDHDPHNGAGDEAKQQQEEQGDHTHQAHTTEEHKTCNVVSNSNLN
jgi:hypothetical protein